MKKAITLVLALFITVMLCGTSEASVGSKQHLVNYRNIKLTLNNNPVTVLPANEPFIINGTTYLPLRAVAESLNFNVTWQDATSTVVMTSKESAELVSLRNQLAIKDQEILALKKQIDNLKGDDLSDLEENIIDDYDEIEDVSVEDINLDGGEDEVKVTVEVDLDKYDIEWEDLSDTDIQNFIKNMVTDIQNELSEDTEVTGELIDIESDDTLITFLKDGERALKITFKDDVYRDGGSSSDISSVIDDLESSDYELDGIGYFAEINYNISNDKVLLLLYADEDSNASSIFDSENIISDLESLCEDIVNAFEDDADVDPEIFSIYIYDEDNTRLDIFTYDIDDETIS